MLIFAVVLLMLGLMFWLMMSDRDDLEYERRGLMYFAKLFIALICAVVAALAGLVISHLLGAPDWLCTVIAVVLGGRVLHEFQPWVVTPTWAWTSWRHWKRRKPRR